MEIHECNDAFEGAREQRQEVNRRKCASFMLVFKLARCSLACLSLCQKDVGNPLRN